MEDRLLTEYYAGIRQILLQPVAAISRSSCAKPMRTRSVFSP